MEVGLFGKLLLIFPVFVFIPGFILQRSLFREETSMDILEKTFVRIFISILVSTFSGLVLGVAGFFNLQNLIVSNIVISFIGMLLSRFRFSSGKIRSLNFSLDTIVLVLLILVAYFFCFRPSEMILGNTNSGNIMAFGGSLVKSGSFFDFSNEDFGFSEISLLQENILPNNGINRNVTVSQPFPSVTVWFAVFQGLFGPEGCLYLGPFFAALGVFFLFFLGKWMFLDYKIGLLSAGFLSVNVLQFWFGRYASSVMLAQCLLSGGAACILRYYNYESVIKKRYFWAGIISLVLAGTLRGDVMPILAVFAGCILCDQDFKQKWLPFLLLTVISLVSCLRFEISADPENLVNLSMWFLIPAVVAFVSLRYSRETGYFFSAILLFTVALGFIIRPSGSRVAAITPILWVIPFPVVVLGAGGVLHNLTYCDEKQKFNRVVWFGVLFSALFSINYGVHRYPSGLEPWAMFAVPVFLISFSSTLYKWVTDKKKIHRWIIAIGIGVFSVVYPLYENRQLILFRESPGLFKFCENMSKEFANWEIVVCNDNKLAVPLKYLFGRKVMVTTPKGNVSLNDSLKYLQALASKGWSVYYVTTAENKSFESNNQLMAVAINSFWTKTIRESLNSFAGSTELIRKQINIFKIREEHK